MLHLEKNDSLGMAIRPRGYKTFCILRSNECGFIMLINVKMPTIVGIFTIMSMVTTASESLKTRNGFTFQYCYFFEQFKLYAQLR